MALRFSSEYSIITLYSTLPGREGERLPSSDRHGAACGKAESFMMWTCRNLERPVIIREYFNSRVFGLQQLVEDGTIPAGEFPLLAFRLYTRYQDMDVEAVAVLADSGFLANDEYVALLRKNCARRLGAFGQMVDLSRDASGLGKTPPPGGVEPHRFAFLTDVSGQRYASSLVTLGYTHARACADAVKILARHLAETETPSILAVASGIAEDATGYWCTDLCRPGTERNCTVLDMDGSYPFKNGQNYIVYTV